MSLADLPLPVVISGITIGLSLARPRFGTISIDKAQAAVIGVVLTLLTGSVSISEAAADVVFLATPLFTICCLMLMTLLAERAGVFHLIAVRLADRAHGDGRRLFTLVFFTSAACGSVFTNDAAVLIFTPLVFELIAAIDGPSARARVPFLFAVLYAANIAGALIVSNPVNMIIARLLGIGFLEYFAWMALPAAASAGVTYLGLRLAFARTIPATVSTDRAILELQPRDPEGAVRMAILVLLMLAGFFAGEIAGTPPWLAPATAALIGIGVAARDGTLRPRSLIGAIPWSVLVFALGMFVIAHGLRNAGLTNQLAAIIRSAGGTNIGVLTQIVAVLTAGLSALLNNHPSVDAMGWAIADMPVASPLERIVLGLAVVIGGDLGPKMLPIGSLAALIWLKLLAERGVAISTGLYVKLGVPITLAAVIIATLVLSAEVLVVEALAR